MKEIICSMAKWRAIISIVVILSFVAFNMLYERARGPLEGKAAVLQLEDSDTSYIAGRSIAEGGISGIVSLAAAGIMILVWGSFCFSALQAYMAEEKKKMDEASRQGWKRVKEKEEKLEKEKKENEK